MFYLRNAVLALLFPVLLVHLGGCSAAQAPSHEIPDWVRVVVPERDGRSLFVGGASFAATPEAGIEVAADDARSQIHLAATGRFTDLFNSAVHESGIETTAIQRLDFKSAVTADYGLWMAEVARQDSVFYRPCGDADGDERPEAGAPVCQVFVLMSIGVDEWDGRLRELLSVQKKRRREEGELQLAEFADWLARQTLGGKPEGARERSR
jgi:hypothetical protein